MTRSERRHAKIARRLKSSYNKHPKVCVYTGSKGSGIDFKKKKSSVSASGKQTKRK